MPRRSPIPPELMSAPFAVAAAREAGVPRSRLRAPDLMAPFYGVRTTGVAVTIPERCAAYAARMKPGQFFSHATAAILYGMPVPTALESGPLHVSVIHRSTHHKPPESGVIAWRVPRPALARAARRTSG